MIGTNRDLAAMQDAVEHELIQLHTRRLASPAAETVSVDCQIALLHRTRIALSAAMVSRRNEASKDIVTFSRWVSGNGALSAIIPSLG